jgi:long-chain acyl-CoA synthetase
MTVDVQPAGTTPVRDVLAERAEIDGAIAGRTLCSVFAETVRLHPDRPALSWPDGAAWRRLTWAGYREAVRDAALGLPSVGLEPGAFGLIMSRNRPEHVIADLGMVHAGGTPVSVYNTLALEQLCYVADHCGAVLAVIEDAALLDKFLALRDRLPGLRWLIIMDPPGGDLPDGVISWADMADRGRAEHRRDPAAFDAAWQQVGADDVATLVYTSGTTGPPKGVIETHATVLWAMECFSRLLPMGPDDRMVSYLPLAHAAERLFTHWWGFYTGFGTWFCPDAAQLLAALREARPTCFLGVPRIWEKLYAALEKALAGSGDEVGPAALLGQIGLDRCKTGLSGAAPVAPELLQFFVDLGLPMLEGFGMSELCPATFNRAGEAKLGTVGRAAPGVEARLADDGEILLRAGCQMPGYYRDPERTAEAIDADGWLHTGDVGEIDDDGYFRVVDRKKELIITSGGKNISPANLEGLLKQHPLIGQACVIGDRRPYLTALLVLDFDAAGGWARAGGIEANSPAMLVEHPAVLDEVAAGVEAANQRVSRVEQIKRFTLLPDEWTAETEELTPTLKLRRRIIAGRYADQIEAMYAGR